MPEKYQTREERRKQTQPTANKQPKAKRKKWTFFKRLVLAVFL